WDRRTVEPHSRTGQLVWRIARVRGDGRASGEILAEQGYQRSRRDGHSGLKTGAIADAVRGQRGRFGRPGRSVRIELPCEPEHRLKHHLLEASIEPRALEMTERGIEDASGAVRTGPGERKILSSRIDARRPKIHRVRVQRQQHAYSIA